MEDQTYIGVVHIVSKEDGIVAGGCQDNSRTGAGRAHGVVLNVNDGKGACEDCGVRVVDANIYVYQPRALSTGKGIKNAQNGELWPLSV